MDKILKYWREALLIILLIAIVTTCEFNKHLSDANDVLVDKNSKAFNEIKTYVDKNGDLTNQIASYELTVDQLKESGILKDQDIERLKKQVGDLDYLVGYWKGEAKMKGVVTGKFKDTTKVISKKDSAGNVVSTDTVDFKNFGWTNKFLTINEDYYPADNAIALEYSYTLGGFDMTAYRKKTTRQERKANPGLKKRQLVADIKFGDPSIEVSEFTAIVIKEGERKLKWWHWVLIGFGGGIIGEKVF